MPRSLLWPDPRVKPPFGAAEIDWGHPLAPIWCALLNEGGGMTAHDLVRRRDGTVQGTTTTWVAQANGLGVSMSGVTGDGDYISVGNHAALLPARLSVVAMFVWSGAAATYDAVISNTTSTSWGDGWGLYWVADNALGFWAAGTYIQRAVTAAVPGVPTLAIGTFDGTTRELYINGAPGTTDATGGSMGTTGVLELGRIRDNLYNMAGVLSTVAILPRALSPAEVRWLAAEPYAMLRPIVRRRYFVPAVEAVTRYLPTWRRRRR